MKKATIILLSCLIIIFIIHTCITVTVYGEHPLQWEFQSVDTMKYSRDLAREKLHDSSFDTEINKQIEKIAASGATHVAIATPYDDEFLPMLRRWVAVARNYHLNIWFRGNWSGWEGWFGYPRITPEQHLARTIQFIGTNKDLFEDGDVFTACPECENGGPGDPRITKQIDAFRAFQIEEYQMEKQAFYNIHKKVATNFSSMNADVAKLVMDKRTTKAMDGVVVIDHYTLSPYVLRNDIDAIALQSGGKVILGEFGAPIPDIHGVMSDEEQADWLRTALQEVVKSDELSGVNYWVGFGGTTALWEEDGTKKPAADVLETFYKGHAMSIILTDQSGATISGTLRIDAMTYTTGRDGSIGIPFLRNPTNAVILSPGFKEKTVLLTNEKNSITIQLLPEKKSWLVTLQKLLAKLNTLMTIEIPTK